MQRALAAGVAGLVVVAAACATDPGVRTERAAGGRVDDDHRRAERSGVG